MKQQILFRVLILACAMSGWLTLSAQGSIEGLVNDKKDKEPLTGAAILIEGTTNGTTADIDGNFKLSGLAEGKYTLVVSYVSYKPQRIPNVEVKNGQPAVLTISMEDAALQLEGVEVVAQRRTDTELSMLKSVRSALQVVNGVSSQQIGKTLDRDAAEVVRRVPGVTIQDSRFIVVRGLNQRYNNVWLNNAATPSSETDVKAFSFDAVPGSMIDNLLVFKTGSPEFTAEATGGFVRISTKNIPDERFLSVEYGIGYNDRATFGDTYRLPGHRADFLGLGAAARAIPAGFPVNLGLAGAAQRDAYALQLGNRWEARRYTALPDQKFSLAFGTKWNLGNGSRLGTITSLSYGNSYNTRAGMENNAYERFDPETESPTYLYRYRANVYSNEYKLGLMHNWAFQSSGGHRIEFKNIFNQMGMDKTSITTGWNNYRLGNFMYFSNQYLARTTYSGQLSGNHNPGGEGGAKFDWNAGLAYSNRLEPDRQNRSMKQNADGAYEYVLPTVPSINELGRLYLSNHEYVGTLALNYERILDWGAVKPTLKAGEYTEYKTRDYAERSITYRTANNGLYTDEEINALPFETLFTEPYLGRGKAIEADEQTNIANSYEAQNLLVAGYIAMNLPAGKLNVYGGVRAEYNLITLDGHYDANSPVHVSSPGFHLFPSVNASYNLTAKSLVRLAYARTINRPEFREVSPMGYYDFTEKTSVTGNPGLRDAYIQNLDLRFERYPSPAETFSLAAFYKRFANPIEMVSVGTGSAYSFANALGATNYGLELDIRKSLETLAGLRNLSIVLNASYIYSLVEFADTQTERSRPLQGQSPVVLNAALLYQNDKLGLSSSLMYNVMGKRILVAAQLNQGEVVIPDIYEMPRHVVDFTLQKKLGRSLELKFGIKDLLAQPYLTQQTYGYVKDGAKRSATLTNRAYTPGRSVSLGATWRL